MQDEPPPCYPSASFGYVYVVTNAAMPGFVKIGCTGQKDVTKRIDGLFSTGVPVPFVLEFACRVANFKEVEGALHVAFAPHRASPSREFFKIDPQQAVAVLKLLHVEDVTADVNAEPSIISAADKAAGTVLAAKRPKMNFHEMGIPNGSVLTFANGHTTAVVVDAKKVSIEGEILSLTAATQKLKNLPYTVQPSPFWSFGGKLLKFIYDETYEAAE